MGAIEYNFKKEVPQKMLLSQMLFNGYYNELSIDDVLLHELCHWYCSITGKNSRDGSQDFEEELKRIGASSTKTKHASGVFYIGKCEKCNNIVVRKNTKRKLSRYLNSLFYTTKCCSASIVNGDIEEIKDTYEVSEKVKELNKKFKEYYYK